MPFETVTSVDLIAEYINEKPIKGDTVKFFAKTAANNSPLSYQWFINGVEAVNENSSTYSFVVPNADHYVIKCVVDGVESTTFEIGEANKKGCSGSVAIELPIIVVIVLCASLGVLLIKKKRV